MPPDRQTLRNLVGVGLEAADNNYLVSLEARISRHTWHPLFTLSTHQQRDYKERVIATRKLPPPQQRTPWGFVEAVLEASSSLGSKESKTHLP